MRTHSEHRVGTRKFRGGLRGYLARVQAGETFEIAVHGRVIARVSPVDPGEES